MISTLTVPLAELSYSGVVAQWSQADWNMICKLSGPTTTYKRLGSTYQVGELLKKASVSHGNRVDALPYWSSKVTYAAPLGSLKFRGYYRRKDGVAVQNICRDGYQTYHDYRGSVPAECISHAFLTGRDRLFESEVVPSHPDQQFAKEMSETKAKNHLRRGLASVPMLWKERHETLKTIQSKGNAIADVVINRHNSDLRRWAQIKGKRNKIRFARRAAAQHLELIFGIMPLIDDLQGLAEFITQEETTFIKAKGKHAVSEMAKSVKRIKSATQSLEPELCLSSVTHDRQVWSYQTSLRADITSAMAGNAQQLGFSPLYTLYDSVPLSFVLSWFSNFGHWVGSLDPLIGASFRTGSTNFRYTHDVRTEAYGDTNQWTISGASGELIECMQDFDGKLSYYAQMRSDTRTVLSSEPDTNFWFYNNLSFYSVTAGISLAIQRKLKLPLRTMRKSPFKYRGPRTVKNLPPIKFTRS